MRWHLTQPLDAGILRRGVGIEAFGQLSYLIMGHLYVKVEPSHKELHEVKVTFTGIGE